LRTVLALVIVLVILVSGVAVLYLIRAPPSIFARDVIAIIDLDEKTDFVDGYYGLFGQAELDYILSLVEYAYRNESIRAVVLRVDNPGGVASFGEELYYSVKRLREAKPVVASVIGLSASASYMITSASTHIYAAPTSIIGSIGAYLFPMPQKFGPIEETILAETGPYKVSPSEIGMMSILQDALTSFLGTLQAERGQRLRVSAAELSKAHIYSGLKAKDLGLVDELGSTKDAFAKAAELAGISRYTVVSLVDVLRPPRLATSISESAGGNATLRVPSLQDLMALHPSPTLYYAYLPQLHEQGVTFSGQLLSEYQSFSPFAGGSEEWGGGDGKVVLFDLSHGNSFAREEVETLIADLVEEGNSARFVEKPGSLASALREASALVFSPRQPYSDEEVDAVADFLGRGGRLLLIYDPTRSIFIFPPPQPYNPQFSMGVSGTTPINSLANRFGILFPRGYLYNLEEHFLSYRNIYVSDFKNTSLTSGLRRLLLATASPIYSKDGGIAFSSNSTYFSEAEKPGRYSPIVYLEDEGVLALGDQTFLREPYVSMEDNTEFVSRIAAFLVEGR